EGDDIEPLADSWRERIDEGGVEVAAERCLTRDLEVVVLRAERGAADLGVQVGGGAQDEIARKQDEGGAIAGSEIAEEFGRAGAGIGRRAGGRAEIDGSCPGAD